MAENAQVSSASEPVGQGPEGHQTSTSKRMVKADRRGARRPEGGPSQLPRSYKRPEGATPITTSTDAINSFSPEPRLLSVKAAGKYLGGVSRDAVMGLIHSGAVPGISLGRRLLLDKADLDAWVAKAKGQERPRQPGKDWKRRQPS